MLETSVQKNTKNQFFLEQIVKPSWNLIKDEQRLVRRFCLTLLVVLLIIDAMAILFYFKTLERIEKIQDHEFTQYLKNQVEEDDKRQQLIQNKVKDLIQQKKVFLDQTLHNLELTTEDLSELSSYKIQLLNIEKLEILLEQIIQSNNPLPHFRQAAEIYNRCELEMKNLNNYLLPLNQFKDNNEKIDRAIKKILSDININLDNFLGQLTHFGSHIKDRDYIIDKKLQQNFPHFNNTFTNIKKNDKFLKLNNFYTIDFIEYDKTYVPFSNEYLPNIFGAQLTKTVNFNLRLPRLYYCLLQLEVSSQYQFSVKFQYVEKPMKEIDEEKIIFQSEEIQGTFNSPVVYSYYHIFDLPQGDHNLYLRVLSLGRSSQVHFTQNSFTCLSYRNFVQLILIMNEEEQRLSVLTQNSEEIENLRQGFFQRNFRKIREGSLRLQVINMMICGTSGTFFWYPIFYKLFGIVPGFIILFSVLFINYYTALIIVDCSIEAKSNNYMVVVKKYLGSTGQRLSFCTFFSDYFSTFIIGVMISYNIFLYLFYMFGMIPQEAVIDPDYLTFDQDNVTVVKFRIIYCAVAFLSLLPFLLKRTVHGLKYVFQAMIMSIFCLILFMIVDLPQFRSHYIKIDKYQISYFKPFELNQLKFPMILITVFYIQSNLLTAVNSIKNPTKKRAHKIVNYSFLYFLIISSLFGIYGYFCLGDFFTTDLFMLRNTFPGKQFENIYRVILTIMGVSFLLYTSFFNHSFQALFKEIFNTNVNFYVLAIAPMTIAILFSCFYPKIINFLGYNGIISCTPNGFLYPLAMRYVKLKNTNNYLEKIFVVFLFSFISLLAITSFVYILYCDIISNQIQLSHQTSLSSELE